MIDRQMIDIQMIDRQIDRQMINNIDKYRVTANNNEYPKSIRL